MRGSVFWFSLVKGRKLFANAKCYELVLLAVIRFARWDELPSVAGVSFAGMSCDGVTSPSPMERSGIQERVGVRRATSSSPQVSPQQQ